MQTVTLSSAVASVSTHFIFLIIIINTVVAIDLCFLLRTCPLWHPLAIEEITTSRAHTKKEHVVIQFGPQSILQLLNSLFSYFSLVKSKFVHTYIYLPPLSGIMFFGFLFLYCIFCMELQMYELAVLLSTGMTHYTAQPRVCP